MVYIEFDHVDIGPAAGLPRLNVILETDADYELWMTDAVTIRPDVERRLKAQFKGLASQDPDNDYTYDFLLVVDNFSDECLGFACRNFLRTDAAKIVRNFSAVPIWKIDGFSRHLVVFLKTDRDIQINETNGTCAAITKRCFDAVKQHDEFDYLTNASFRMTFDSKQNLDKNFNGSLFYYWR
ncbi:MAG: hypothetical protein AB7G28_16785 [Pirellulales bacterium]